MPRAHYDQQAWEDLLQHLEAVAAAASRGEPEPMPESWSPPADLGPLPAELEARAWRLLHAQHAAISRLGDEQRAVARHLSAVRAVPAVQDAGRSVYLDVTG
ncbi:MAG: hypothetical protein ABWX59_00855 [Microbacteriaceae bacterium]